MRWGAVAIALAIDATTARAAPAPHPCSAELAAAQLPTLGVWKAEGDLRFRMAGIELEALARCREGTDAIRIGLVQVLLDYRIEARYETGRVEVHVAHLPAIDALEDGAPWYPAIRRDVSKGKVRISAHDAPRGFMELKQAFVGEGSLAALEGHARFVTFVAFRREDGELVPLNAIEWESGFTAKSKADGSFEAIGLPARYRVATEDAAGVLATVQREKRPIARRQLEWWWVPHSQEPPRRVAVTR